MKITKKFKLEKTQSEIDFVDIDFSKDMPLFLDAYFLSRRTDRWSIDAHRTIESFFHTILDLYDSGRRDMARNLFLNLSEPNETCLGVSEDAPNGRGVSSNEASKIFNSIVESQVMDNHLVGHLEDLSIFVKDIGKDKISDMMTNIIRGHLIKYTQSQCKLHGIPLSSSIPSGFYWDAKKRSWDSKFTEMLVIEGRKILLVPKGIVSFSKAYTHEQYCQHFVLNFLQQEHIRLNSSLVKRRQLKNGKEKVWVVKQDIAKAEGTFKKEYLRNFTLRNPDVFIEFRNTVHRKTASLTNDELQEESYSASDLIHHLIKKLKEIPTGAKHATEYHKLIIGILELIFYPQLTTPTLEQEIHQGRKRIDISFDNAAQDGFFFELHNSKKIPSPYIFVEVKNYKADVSNPEIDQLAGRFSLNRGKFGILVCRGVENAEKLLERCSDTYRDDRGLIIPLFDNDLIQILESILDEDCEVCENLLRNRMREIILR